MDYTITQSPFSKDHAYVMLGQQDPIKDDREEDIDLDETLESNVSDSSLNNISSSASVYQHPSHKFSDLTKRLSSALFYGTISFLIVIVNKIVLTQYKFPSESMLGIGQVIAILGILTILNAFHVVTIRPTPFRNKNVWILAVIYVVNLVSGLMGTRLLPLPMMIALRRISIAMTALGEFLLLGITQSYPIIFSIGVILAGSFIAAANDLTFNAKGYLLLMTTNLFSAANVVFIKSTIDSRIINKHEILYNNALIAFLPLVLITYLTCPKEDLINFAHWREFGFILSFLGSCCLGYLLVYSTILCTHYNSPLATSVVGSIKNILTTYVGMYVGGDYVFSSVNFIGLNVSLAGSLLYSYLTIMSKKLSPNKNEIGNLEDANCRQQPIKL